MSLKNKFTFIDLFCGCGGLSYGLMQAGHECLLGVDADESALKTFQYNHPGSNIYFGDVAKLNQITIKKLIGNKKVDMVVGGPPCQGFSTVGKGKVEDERNMLFRHFVRIVKNIDPKIILFENVTGLAATKNQQVLKKIFKEFESLGFTMGAEVLSAEEFGVPEKRRRMIIMGVKKGEIRFPLPLKNRPMTVKEAFQDLKAKDGKFYNHDKTLVKISNKQELERLKFIPAGKGIRYQHDEKKYLPKKLWHKINWDQLPEGRFRQTRYQRLPWDAPAPTILTSKNSYYHPRESRFLTPREAAKCQSFPNDFIFYGSITSMFRQIGNAVPPKLAYEIGQEIKKIRFNIKKKNKEIVDWQDLRKSFHYVEQKNVA